MDQPAGNRAIVQRLESAAISFIDVGMGLHATDARVTRALRVTTSTSAKRALVHDRSRIPLSVDDGDAAYSTNIRVGDLNALNAALAVIRWKWLCGFYPDLEHEHFSAFSVDGIHLFNDDRT